MNWFQRIRNAITWRVPQPRIYVGRTQAGVAVTEDSAQTFSAVGACVRIIAETMGSLPWPVYRRMEAGREAMPNHPVNWLLNFQPNPEQTAMQFRRQALMHYLLWGNFYAEIERGLDGRPIALWPLMPDRAYLWRNFDGSLVCRVSSGSDYYEIPRANVFHLADGSFDGFVGVSRINLARRAIGAGIAQDVFTAAYYGNGASIGGVIEQKTGKTLSPEAAKTMLASFNEQYAGPERAHKTLYLDAGMGYTPVPIPLSDAEFMASRHFQVEEVCRWFGVPQHMVQMLTETNYAISYTADKNFVEHTLRPIAVLMEQEANVRLFGQRAQGSVYSRMNLAALMRGDPKMRAEYYRALINSGVISINEVRELEEMNSIGKAGDEHYLQVNMTTIEKIAEGFSTFQGTPGADTTPNEAKPGQADPITENAFQLVDNVIRREALEWWNARKEANGTER